MTTAVRLDAAGFLRRLRLLIGVSWGLPPVFGLSFLLFVVALFTPAQLGQMLLTPPLPVFIVVTQLIVDRYFVRFSQPLVAYLEAPSPEREAAALARARRFPLHFWVHFIVYLLLAPVSVVASARLAYGFAPDLVAWFRLALTALVVSIIVGLPIFFLVIDLFGEVFRDARLRRPQVTLQVKVFLIGALVPLLIDTMLVQYYWTATGYFTWGTFGVWLVLEALAVAGSLMLVRSLRRALEPLKATMEQEPERIDPAVLRPTSTDELGVLTSGFRGLLEGVQQHAALRERQQQLELELVESRRLEGVGRLAGGVAHDFNNILTAIVGAAASLSPGDAPQAHQSAVEDILSSAQRAADLTRQLLAFSRRQVLAPTVVDVNQVLDGLARLLRRLAPSSAELRFELEPGLGPVLADRGQLEQVVVNLVVNARDAITGHGTIVVRTRSVQRAPTPEAPSGAWVQLSVVDTGTGIAPDVLERIFDPYFSTKAEGKGAGLGLATVHGIVTQTGGTIEVDTEPGRGTSFVITLPCTTREEQPLARPAPRAEAGAQRRTRVLLAEDDEALRRVVTRALTQRGFEVVGVERGDLALQRLEVEPAFDVLLTDMVMPGLTGAEVAREARARYPQLPILIMSGYAEAAAVAEVRAAGFVLVPKPFTPAELVSQLAAVVG